MSTPVPGRVEVDAPPIEPYTYGLLSVAQVETRDGRWQNGGVEYETDACAQGGRVEGSCPVPVPTPPEELVTATLTATPGDGAGGGGLGFYIYSDPQSPRVGNYPGVLMSSDAGIGTRIIQQTPEGGEPGSSVYLLDGAELQSVLLRTEGVTTWTFTDNTPNVPQCPAPVTVTLPDPNPAEPQLLGACTVLAYPVVWASDPGSETAVTYTVRDPSGAVVDSGTLQPGETAEPVIYLSPQDYTTTYSVPGGANTVDGTVPLALPGGTYTQNLTLDPALAPTTTHSKPIAEGSNWVEGGPPFSVYHRAECSPVGFDQAQQRALAKLRLIEPREVEKAFSLQLAAETVRTPLGTTAVPLEVALGALEQDAALHYAGQPTLHAPRWTQPRFTEARLVSQQGPVLRTELESRIAFGGGYYDDPAAPSDPNPAGGLFWLYATGTVRAHRSQPFAHEAFEPTSNTRTAIAERTYALDHDCYAAAVLVTVAPAGGGA